MMRKKYWKKDLLHNGIKQRHEMILSYGKPFHEIQREQLVKIWKKRKNI